MKTTLFAFLCVLAVAGVTAQIPNQGFEDWTNMGSYQNPSLWGTMNNTTASYSVFTATKGTPGAVGACYLKLTSKQAGSSIVNGMAVSGVLDSITLQPQSGFSYTLRPQGLKGKWQHMIFGSSQGTVQITLTRWNTASGQQEIVANGLHTLAGMEMNWVSFSIDLSYLSGEFPDTCIIILKASGPNPSQDDFLYVDDLNFFGMVPGIDENEAANATLTVFPNPAGDEVTLTFTRSFVPGNKLRICDISGKVMIEKVLTETSCKINTSAFSAGTYIYQLINGYGFPFAEGKICLEH